MNKMQNKPRKQEERVAKIIGGRRNLCSGALREKGDVQSKDVLVSCKRTDKGQIIIKLKDIEEIYGQAMRNGREPILQIEIGGFEVWGQVIKK